MGKKSAGCQDKPQSTDGNGGKSEAQLGPDCDRAPDRCSKQISIRAYFATSKVEAEDGEEKEQIKPDGIKDEEHKGDEDEGWLAVHEL